MEEIIFPNQIRMFRRLRGRSMQELADHLGVSLSAISKIEKGYRRVDQEQLVRVAEFLDCPLQELFVNEQNSQQEIVQSWRREQERRNKINEKSGLKTLGAGLRQIRNEKNLTLIEVAESADMTLSVYHRIEMGQREVSDKEFKNIAKALEMTSEELKEEIKTLEDKGLLEEILISGARVSGVAVNSSGSRIKIKLDGIFVALGTAGGGDFAATLGLPLEEKNGSFSIKVNQDYSTGIPGLFAAGDLTGGFLQVANSVAQGAFSAQSINKYLKSLS